MDYKERIVELLDKIDTTAAAPDGIASGNKFLERIYISLREYVGEVEDYERRARKVAEQWKSPYEANATMKLLGYQSSVNVCKDLETEMRDIMNARPYTTTIETALDMVMLGYITGIRAERKRRAEGWRKAV